MVECIENILWTTTECMLPKFPVHYHLLTVVYGTALFWRTRVIQRKNINHCSLLVLLDL